MEIRRPNIFHFKAFGMINLHYEIRFCQKIYNNRVTMTVYVKCVVRFNVNKMLSFVPKPKFKLPRIELLIALFIVWPF